MSAEIPEVQRKLQAALEAEFGSQLTVLPSHAWTEYGLAYEIKREGMLEIFRKLKIGNAFLFNMLINVTAVDWMDVREPRFDVVYQLLSLTHKHRLMLKIQASEADPKVHSVRSLWPTADFQEREVWDMFGIVFEGHGDLRRILMYDEFVGHPLRKDYAKGHKQPRVPLRIPELHNSAKDMRRETLVALPTRRREQGAV